MSSPNRWNKMARDSQKLEILILRAQLWLYKCIPKIFYGQLKVMNKRSPCRPLKRCRLIKDLWNKLCRLGITCHGLYQLAYCDVDVRTKSSRPGAEVLYNRRGLRRDVASNHKMATVWPTSTPACQLQCDRQFSLRSRSRFR